MTKKGFNDHIITPGMEAEYRLLMAGQTTDANGKPINTSLVLNTAIIEAVSLPAAMRKV